MPHEPKRKHSKARKRVRRASIKMEQLGFVRCQNCQEPALPHQACKNCGFYAGKVALAKSKAKVTRV